MSDYPDLVELMERFGVSLKKRGQNYMGLCPFHNDTKPSLSVNREKGLWHCFGCGAKGTAVGFVARTKGLSKQHAKRWLLEGNTPWEKDPDVVTSRQEVEGTIF